MNYIEQLNAFKICRKLKPISVSAGWLYFILFEYNNELAFMKDFTVANSTLQGLSGLSESTLKRSRNELVQKGYIDYKKGLGNQCGKYELVDLIIRFDLQSDRQSDLQSDLQSDRQLNRKVTSLYKLNKTKQNNNIYNSANEEKPKEKSTKFIKPSIEEIKEYLKEKGYNIDAEYFWNHYETRNWYLKNGEKMYSWKACLATWNKNEKKFNTNIGVTQKEENERTSYDIEKYEKFLEQTKSKQ